jgi:recombinational DNA repair protein (RecF pathway)
MSYKTYITDALVCGSKPSNTSDKSFLLFTREAGMLWANAKSVREERSKHRYALQECSRVRVNLVRGKSGWKVTGAEAYENYYTHASSREERALVRDMLRLLRRLVHGEEAVLKLYDELVCALHTIPKERESVHALIFALRALHLLGYLASTDQLSNVLDVRVLYRDLYDVVGSREVQFRTYVEKALTETHL